MAGDTKNASLWAEADVYIAPLNAAPPASADAEFGSEWSLVGLLDGDEGFSDSRDQEENKFFAWGGILVKQSRTNFEFSRTFTVLEDNPVTRQLIWPGSTPGKIVVPRPQPLKVAFEVREGSKVRRLITANYAEINVDGEVKESESDLTKYPLKATIFPDGDSTIFIEQVTGETTDPGNSEE